MFNKHTYRPARVYAHHLLVRDTPDILSGDTKKVPDGAVLNQVAVRFQDLRSFHFIVTLPVHMTNFLFLFLSIPLSIIFIERLDIGKVRCLKF